MNNIIDYLDDLNNEGMYDSCDNVFEKLGNLIEKLLIDHQDKVCEFLAYHIINSKDESIQYYFIDLYEDYDDADRKHKLFCYTHSLFTHIGVCRDYQITEEDYKQS